MNNKKLSYLKDKAKRIEKAIDNHNEYMKNGGCVKYHSREQLELNKLLEKTEKEIEALTQSEMG